eukprot:scaffold230317_cov19-Tisochrysis_lutea.AAC.2
MRKRRRRERTRKGGYGVVLRPFIVLKAKGNIREYLDCLMYSAGSASKCASMRGRRWCYWREDAQKALAEDATFFIAWTS